MLDMKYLFLLLLNASSSLATVLVSFNATAGDDPSKIGTRDLEAARGVTQSDNSDDLYIKLDKDPSGVPAAHYHRVAADIRAEYHALNGKFVADTTYFIGYSFSLAQIEQSLMIWQM